MKDSLMAGSMEGARVVDRLEMSTEKSLIRGEVGTVVRLEAITMNIDREGVVHGAWAFSEWTGGETRYAI